RFTLLSRLELLLRLLVFVLVLVVERQGLLLALRLVIVIVAALLGAFLVFERRRFRLVLLLARRGHCPFALGASLRRAVFGLRGVPAVPALDGDRHVAIPVVIGTARDRMPDRGGNATEVNFRLQICD